MSRHVLRNFIYLDNETVSNYLSGLGILSEGESIREVTERVGGFSVGSSLPVVKADGKKESKHLIESTKQVVHTDAVRFQQLYGYLENKDILEYYETMDDEIWSTIGRDDILEVGVDMALPKMLGVIEALNQYNEIAGLMEQATGKSPIDENTQQIVTAVQQLMQLDPRAGIPISLRFIGATEYVLISSLDPAFLKVDRHRLTGQATIVCKVQKKLRSDEQYELFNLFHLFERFAINDDIKQSLADGLEKFPKEYRDTITAPAAIVTPIAVYR